MAKKSWLDVTDKEIRDFLTEEESCESVRDIRRHRKENEITCLMVTTWESGDEDDEYNGEKGVLPIEDGVILTHSSSTIHI